MEYEAILTILTSYFKGKSWIAKEITTYVMCPLLHVVTKKVHNFIFSYLLLHIAQSTKGMCPIYRWLSDVTDLNPNLSVS